MTDVMTEQEIIKMQRKVREMLDSLRISEAIDLTGEMLARTGLTRRLDDIAQLRDTYRYMIHYFMEGVPDASRDRQIAEIGDRLITLTDLAIRELKGKEGSDIYSSTLRYNNLRSESVGDLLRRYGDLSSMRQLSEAAESDDPELRRESEVILTNLFDAIFTSFGRRDDYRLIAEAAQSDYPDKALIAQAISALTLSLLFYYDRDKLETLLDIYENATTEKIAAKSLLGIVMTLVTHAERVNSNQAIKTRLSLWNDSIETYRRLRETVRVIVGSRDTERVATKMKEEVLPELQKLRPEIMKTMQEMPGDIDPSMLENNPEWEEILDRSGLSKKMQELNELQNDGADLMMVTFSNLKQFPFFNHASNWFLPFDARHTALKLTPEMRRVVESLLSVGNMICDSDMYSLASAFSQMPERQRQMISSQFNAQFEQMNEQMKDDRLKTSTPEFDLEILKSTRDLYRFFKLYRNRQGFPDPFLHPLDFISLPVIGEMMKDEEVVRLIGEFYFKRGYHAEALPLLQMLTEENHDDATLWEKIGFCQQQLGDYAGADESYTKALLLRHPGTWLLKRLAFTRRKLGNYPDAADYYEQLLEMEPENVSAMMNAGNTWLEADNPSTALKHFHHANYLQPDNPGIMRAIAWSELLVGNYAKSADYYNKIIGTGAQGGDYLNAGHAQLMLGNIREAVNLYRLAADNSDDRFTAAFEADIPTLTKLGADPKSLRLILDIILQATR